MTRIFYVCTTCEDSNPEDCGHADNKDLRVIGENWVCENCFFDNEIMETLESWENFKPWNDYQCPPEYEPKLNVHKSENEK